MKVKHLAALHNPNARSAHPVSETCDVSRCNHYLYNLPFGYSIDLLLSFTGIQKCPRLMKETGTRLGLVEVCKGVLEISDTLRLSNRSVRSGAVKVVYLTHSYIVLSRNLLCLECRRPCGLYQHSNVGNCPSNLASLPGGQPRIQRAQAGCAEVTIQGGSDGSLSLYLHCVLW